jgi:N,N'-diacetyllegionaminate synthase
MAATDREEIAMTNAVTIIAEAGVNHNGDLELARRLVQAAAEAGADFVKFQTFSAERLLTRAAPKAEYQLSSTDPRESQLEMIRRLELTAQMHEQLVAECGARGIQFLSSAFDIDSLDLLARLGQSLFKVPSGEITNLPYLRHIARYARPVILSTGMATLSEIEAALDALEASGLSRALVTLLHCNTEYPTPMCDVNLRAMQALQVAFGVSVGYSDHTAGIEIPIAAAALGACVIEKHLTVDRNLPGPDHRASLEPGEFAAMVRAVRNVEAALGDGIKRPSASERKNRVVARKSIVASRAIGKGEVFCEDNLAVKRPGSGLSPMLWDQIVGRTAGRDFAPDEPIEW